MTVTPPHTTVTMGPKRSRIIPPSSCAHTPSTCTGPHTHTRLFEHTRTSTHRVCTCMHPSAFIKQNNTRARCAHTQRRPGSWVWDKWWPGRKSPPPRRTVSCRPATPAPRNSATNRLLDLVSAWNASEMLLNALGVAPMSAMTAPPKITIQYRTYGS
jgi:hypothetical protein